MWGFPHPIGRVDWCHPCSAHVLAIMSLRIHMCSFWLIRRYILIESYLILLLFIVLWPFWNIPWALSLGVVVDIFCDLFILFYVHECFVCVCVYENMHAWCPCRLKKGHWTPRIKITNSYEPQCECWTKIWSSARTVNTPNLLLISPDPNCLFEFSYYIQFLFIYFCVCVFVHIPLYINVFRGHFQVSIFSFYHVGYRSWTQIAKLGSWHFHVLKHLPNSIIL